MGVTQRLGTIPLAIQTDSSNNVGIGGAANASYKLDVTGTIRATGSIFGDVGFRTKSLNGYLLKNDADSANLGGLVRRSYWAGGAALDTQIFAETGYGIFLNVNGSSSTGMVINSSGNLGIGTTTVTEGTQAAGSISIIPVSSVSSAPLIQFPGNGRIRPASAGDRLSIDGNSLLLNSTFNGNVIMTTGGGNVGIATSSPSTTLTVYKTRLGSITTQTPNNLYLQSEGYTGSGYNTIDFGSTSYGVPLARIGVGIFGDGTYMMFGTSNAYNTGITNVALNINPNGNVGIGNGTTGSPNNRLLVQGGNIAKATTFGFDGNVDNMIKYGAQQDINASGQFLDRWIGIDATVTAGGGSGNVMYFKVYSGGGSGSPRTAAYFNGDGSVFNYNNTTTWQQSSDARIKSNIRTLENAIAVVSKLNPVLFDYTDSFVKDKQWDNKKQYNSIGFIAQEFEEVFPEYVQFNEEKIDGVKVEDFRTIDTGHLVPYLVKAIQELSAKVTALENK